jgi:HlyD family secretion protein
MNAKRFVLFFGLVLLVVGGGGAGWVANHFWTPSPTDEANRQRQLPGGRELPGGRASPSTDEDEGVVCTGYVDLEHGVRSLAPLHPGRVAALIAKENEHVAAGAPLLRLEDRDAKYQRDEAESAVTAAQIQLADALKSEERQRARLAQQQAAVEGAGYRLDAARQMLQHREKQVKDDLATDEEVRLVADEVKALEQKQVAEREKLAELKTVDPALMVRKARTELRLAQIRRDRAQHQLDECTLTAPTSGTVQRIGVGVGDLVSGNPMQTIVRFCPDETPLVRAEVNQEFADRVRVGQTAQIRDVARSGASWRGKVERVADWYERRRPTTQDPSAFTDVRTVECLITIAPGQPPLRLGQRMRVMIGRVP